MADIVLGIDLGGTNVKTALVSRERTVIAKELRPTRAADGPDAVMDTMASSARALLEQAGVTPGEVLVAGVGAPGPMNWRTGVVYSPPNLPGWKDVPLAQAMHDRLGVPCFVENDANAACYGEFWMGAGQGCENMAMLTLGTGVGGGLIINGELLRGPDGTAGELGHIVVQRNGRASNSPARGVLEAYASVTGMVQTAREGLATHKMSVLIDRCGGDTDQLTGRMIFEAAMQGDELAEWVFRETATWLGLGIASIVHYQNPEKVVLAGGMVEAGDVLLQPLREVVAANTFAVPGRRCEILATALGPDAGVLGAAGAALARIDMGDAA